MTKYFTEEQMKEDLLETLKWFDEYYCDLPYEVFGFDYYVIGTSEAKEALMEYGFFEALNKLNEYWQFNFGETYPTNNKNPEDMATDLYYILGLEFLNNKLVDYWNLKATPELNAEIKQLFK